MLRCAIFLAVLILLSAQAVAHPAVRGNEVKQGRATMDDMPTHTPAPCRGVPRISSKALSRLRKAAEQGNASAEYKLSQAYLCG